MAGAAASGATVTVNTSSAGVVRHGEYFFKPWPMANGSSTTVFATLAISDGGTPQPWEAFTAGTPEPFTYDDDGNLTRDGRWVYQYDAENRLVAMFTRGAPNDDPSYSLTANAAIWGSGVARQKLQFTYDYLGRRVGKLVSNWDSGGSVWDPDTEERFVYDGWNLMARLNASSLSLIASYYWGLDWSGTLQGAGGVGGLALAQTLDPGTQTLVTCLPAYDGNGNIHGMIKASDGSLAAAYEYDAFGQTLRESGTYAASNPFRFSTKYTDTETGLVYYGTRHYAPTLGRFLNRDPIEEQGGLNLYGFVANNPVNKWDYLGQVMQDQYFAAPGDDEFDRQMQVIWGNRVDLVGMMDGLRSMQSFNTGWNERAAAENASGGSGSPDVISVIAGILTGGQSGASGGGGSGASGSGSSGVGGSILGNALRDIPLVGRILGGAGDIASGLLGTAAGIATLGQSGSLRTGLSDFGNGLKSTAVGGLDLAGKTWASPATAVGLAWGLTGALFGADISIGNNAVQFENHPFMSGAITFGNTISYSKDLGPETYSSVYGRNNNVGRHEKGHTYQYQLFGPLFPLLYLPRGLGSSNNPLEQAADDYSLGGDWFRMPLFGSGKPK